MIEIGGNLAAAIVAVAVAAGAAAGSIASTRRKKPTSEADLAILTTEIRRLRDEVGANNRELERK